VRWDTDTIAAHSERTSAEGRGLTNASRRIGIGVFLKSVVSAQFPQPRCNRVAPRRPAGRVMQRMPALALAQPGLATAPMMTAW